MSKQGKRRHMFPRKRQYNLSAKTGAKKSTLKTGYREHVNSLPGELAQGAFIPKIKGVK